MARRGAAGHFWLLVFVTFLISEILQGLAEGLNTVRTSNGSEAFNLTFFPPSPVIVVWKQNTHVQFQVHSEVLQVPVGERADVPLGQLCILSEDENVASLQGANVFPLEINGNEEFGPSNKTIVINGVFLGRTRLRFYSLVNEENNVFINYTNAFGSQNLTIDSDEIQTRCDLGNGENMRELSHTLELAVVRPDRIVDKIFLAVVTLLVIVANIGMGCKIDLDVVKEVLKRPIAPVIGFCCQFLIMPLAAFAFSKAFGLSGGVALGFFATGCAPGGGSSNMYTFLLNGDVSLSVTMTLISLVAATGMIPLWLFTLGRLYLAEHGLKIPYHNIIISMVCVILPVGIGLLIQKKKPKAAQFIVKRILRVWFIVIILFMFTFGIWTNLYVFKLIKLPIILAACALPYTGFLLSGLASFVCRQPRNRIMTIAIETAIQNTGIPIILMKFSLPQPEGDMSIIGPVVVAMFTPLPLWIAIIVQEIRKRCCNKSEKEFTEVAGEEAETTNGGLLVKKQDNGFPDDDEPTFDTQNNKTKSKTAMSSLSKV